MMNPDFNMYITINEETSSGFKINIRVYTLHIYQYKIYILIDDKWTLLKNNEFSFQYAGDFGNNSFGVTGLDSGRTYSIRIEAWNFSTGYKFGEKFITASTT